MTDDEGRLLETGPVFLLRGGVHRVSFDAPTVVLLCVLLLPTMLLLLVVGGVFALLVLDDIIAPPSWLVLAIIGTPAGCWLLARALRNELAVHSDRLVLDPIGTQGRTVIPFDEIAFFRRRGRWLHIRRSDGTKLSFRGPRLLVEDASDYIQEQIAARRGATTSR